MNKLYCEVVRKRGAGCPNPNLFKLGFGMYLV